jgi:putative peptide zinc metalloprotease protein
MAEALFHPHWYRVADLHPRLRGHVTLRRQVVRGQVWYVLSDPADGRHFRLNPLAYRFVGLCDGRRSVAEVWQDMTEALGDDAPTQADLVGILGRLSDGGLLQTEALPDVDVMFEQRTVRRERQQWSQLNPLFFRVRLLDPSPYLRPFEPWLPRLFSGTGFALWLVLVLSAGLLAASHWPALVAQAGERLTSPRFLLLSWLVYPLIKAVHELGHALAIRRWGGRVSKIGITLLLLMPIPWVDASAASAFRQRRHRLMVSAAGIMVELLLAALALFLWLVVEPGLVRDAALATMIIAGVSTLLFNGNPLMRYDGYFILADAIDLPNLAPRSATYWTWLARRHLLGQTVEPPLTAPGERRWLLFYGLASFLYRIVVSLAIVVWLSGVSVWLAVVAGLILLWTFFVGPGATLVRNVRTAVDGPREARRARRVGWTTALLLAALLFAVPLPLRIVADGLVWLPENARVRPETDGFVVRLLADNGARVAPGQPLLELRDAELLAERDRLFARLAKFQNEQFGVLTQEPGKARDLAEEIESLQAAIQLNETRLNNLVVRAGSPGRLVIPRQNDLPDSFVPRGTEVGYILDEAPARVRAVVAQQDVALVRERLRGAEVWLAELAEARDSRPDRDTPAATVHLPSPALGDRGGGGIATDAKDDKGQTAVAPVFLVDLELPATHLPRVGARAEVRFDLGYEPLAGQAWRRLRQLFLSHFTQTG